MTDDVKARTSSGSGPVFHLWWRFSSRAGPLLSSIFVGTAVLIACFAPLLSNEKPISLVTDEGTISPLLRALAPLDVAWCAFGVSLLAFWIAARIGHAMGSSAAICGAAAFAITLTIGLVFAAQRREFNDPRPYSSEIDWRRRLAIIDELAKSTESEEVIIEWESLMLEASNDFLFCAEIEGRLLRHDVGRPDIADFVERNRIALGRLEAAVFTVHRQSPDRVDSFRRKLAPLADERHPLGTDAYGRDVLAVVIHGTRTALTTAMIAVALSSILGLVIGGVAGYAGGVVDWSLSRIFEVLTCIPALVFVVILGAYLPRSTTTLAMVLGILLSPHAARLVRAEVLRVKGQDFVRAAVVLGATPLRVLRTHVLPHAVSPLLVNAGLAAGTVILAESSLSFLGLGESGVISWGTMIHGARADPSTLWQAAVFPGLAVFTLILTLNILAEGCRVAFDPNAE